MRPERPRRAPAGRIGRGCRRTTDHKSASPGCRARRRAGRSRSRCRPTLWVGYWTAAARRSRGPASRTALLGLLVALEPAGVAGLVLEPALGQVARAGCTTTTRADHEERKHHLAGAWRKSPRMPKRIVAYMMPMPRLSQRPRLSENTTGTIESGHRDAAAPVSRQRDRAWSHRADRERRRASQRPSPRRSCRRRTSRDGPTGKPRKCWTSANCRCTCSYTYWLCRSPCGSSVCIGLAKLTSGKSTPSHPPNTTIDPVERRARSRSTAWGAAARACSRCTGRCTVPAT